MRRCTAERRTPFGGDLAVFTGINNQNNTMAPFTLDTQWHISVVLKKDGNGGTWIRSGRERKISERKISSRTRAGI